MERKTLPKNYHVTYLGQGAAIINPIEGSDFSEEEKEQIFQWALSHGCSSIIEKGRKGIKIVQSEGTLTIP